MPVKDVCSSNSSGQKPKPQPLPGSNKSRNVKHAAVYRGDQVQPSGPKSTRDCGG